MKVRVRVKHVVVKVVVRGRGPHRDRNTNCSQFSLCFHVVHCSFPPNLPLFLLYSFCTQNLNSLLTVDVPPIFATMNEFALGDLYAYSACQHPLHDLCSSQPGVCFTSVNCRICFHLRACHKYNLLSLKDPF